MLEITKSKWIREQTKIQDIIKQGQIKKWRWAGHLARTKDNRRTTNNNNGSNRWKTRWRDEIVKFAGMTWMRTAQDRSK